MVKVETRVTNTFNTLHPTMLPAEGGYHYLHSVAWASEKAYSGVVYLRMEDSTGAVHTSLIVSKTRVAPIKRLTIPRLELNGALIMARLISHCKDVLDLPLDSVHAWTDSTIVLAWIRGNPH